MAKFSALTCVFLLGCIHYAQSMLPLPVEDECQPAKSPNMAKMQAKLNTDCNKCCAGMKVVTNENSVKTTCIKYSEGSYTTLAGTTACFCDTDFKHSCTVDVCQPATRRLDGSSIKLSKSDIETNNKNCQKCCKAQVVPNVGTALDHPTLFQSGGFQTSDNKCWCKRSSS